MKPLVHINSNLLSRLGNYYIQTSFSSHRTCRTILTFAGQTRLKESARRDVGSALNNSQNRYIFSTIAETLGGGPGKKLKYEEKHLIGYSMEQMFNIVSRVEKYSEFVPWCKESTVMRTKNHNSYDCQLTVGFPPLVEKYTSRVTVEKPTMVKVEFQFRHSLHSNLAQIFFDEVIKKMVKAFFMRAETLYGPQSIKPERLKVLSHESH